MIGEGFDCLKKTLFYARSGLASAVVGTAQAAVDAALAHARERKQFGQSIGRFQVLAHRLAHMQTDVDLARLLTRELAKSIDAGKDCTRLSAQAKLVTTETLKKLLSKECKLWPALVMQLRVICNDIGGMLDYILLAKVRAKFCWILSRKI